MFEENTKTIHMRNELNKLSISSDDKGTNADNLKEIMKLFSEGKTFSQLPERLAELAERAERAELVELAEPVKKKKFDPECDKDIKKVLKEIRKQYSTAGMEKYYDDGRVLRNWLKGKGNPQFTSDPRTKGRIIQLFFVFKMNEKECEEFASKAFFIQAFNIRDIRDLIALYCINNKKTYDDFLRIFEPFEEDYAEINNYKRERKKHKTDTNCKETVILKEDFEKVNTEDKLIGFIKDNKAAFKDDHKYARNILNELSEAVKSVCGIVYEIEKVRNNRKDEGEQVEMNIAEYTKCSDDLPLTQKSEINGNVKDLFEIMLDSERWSEVTNYTGNSNDLRKLIIYFYFYVYHKKYENTKPEITEINNKYKNVCRHIEDELKKFINNDGNTDKEMLDKMDRYKRTVDALMVGCNFQPLYLRNPYDCIFIYSAGCQHPIETLQWLLAEITGNWPGEEGNWHDSARRTKDDNQPSYQMMINMMSGTNNT